MTRPNVLLIVLDSVRARNVGAYGHVHETTPFLDSFAAERATLYEQARSPGARSVTSHASLFSGYHVEEHGVVSACHRLDPSTSVFSALREDGYRTGVFTENDWLTAVNVGLKEGFDDIVGARNIPFPHALNPHEFVSNEGKGQYVAFVQTALASDYPFRSLVNGFATKVQSDYRRFLPSSARASTPADAYIDAFLDWIDRREGTWAACLNLMDAHIPYEPSTEYDEWGGSKAASIQDSFEDQKWDFNGRHRPWWQKKAVESLYDGSIKEMDAELDRLVSALDRRNELDDTLLVVTSDHGEGFGEPSHVRPDVRIAEHGVAIHDVVLHVPLVVKFPGQTESRRVSQPASLTEFPRAVDSVRSGDHSADVFCPDGPVLSTAVGLDRPLQERAGAYVDDLSPWMTTSRAVFEYDGDGVMKYCTNRERAVSVRCLDAQTSYKLSDTGADRVQAAFESVADRDVRTAGNGIDELDESTYQHLKELGYV